MDIPAKTLSQRSGFGSSILSPVLTAAILWLGAYAASLDQSTVRGLLVGALVTGLVAALTFIRAAFRSPSVDPAMVPISAGRVIAYGRVCNCPPPPPVDPEAPHPPG